jgi:hypothetical protein
LDLSQNPKLGNIAGMLWGNELDCSNNKLTSLDLGNNPELRMINLSGNQLVSLDVSGNPNLFGHFEDIGIPVKGSLGIAEMASLVLETTTA